MLGVNSYKADYVAACRARIDGLMAEHAKLTTTEAFDQAFLNHALLALDHDFLHRLRGAEGKDGNPLNELRMLCNSIQDHGGVLTADSTIKYKPEVAVLGLALGQPVRLDADGFRRLATAVFAEISKRYP